MQQQVHFQSGSGAFSRPLTPPPPLLSQRRRRRSRRRVLMPARWRAAVASGRCGPKRTQLRLRRLQLPGGLLQHQRRGHLRWGRLPQQRLWPTPLRCAPRASMPASQRRARGGGRAGLPTAPRHGAPAASGTLARVIQRDLKPPPFAWVTYRVHSGAGRPEGGSPGAASGEGVGVGPVHACPPIKRRVTLRFMFAQSAEVNTKQYRTSTRSSTQ